MKKMAFIFVLMAAGLYVYAQSNLPQYYPASGRWAIMGGRLYQNDENAWLARANIPVVQDSDIMYYEFNARYEGGAEDGHGGFGLHIFMDEAFNGASWGAGQSYLFWLNYDNNPASRDIHAGFSAQIYRSISNFRMELIQSFDLNDYAHLLTEENLSQPINFRIYVNSNTGEVRVHNPVGNFYYVLDLGRRYLPLRGSWIALRTNSLKMSFSTN